MGFTVDIDTGGTFTDAFVTDGTRSELVKVETTPHDFTVCFLNAVTEAAERFGMPEREFLARTDAIRYSTTVGTNALIQRQGAAIGVISGVGADAWVAAAGEFASVVGDLVKSDLVATIPVHDENGVSVLDADEIEIRRVVATLLDRGAASIVVALSGSHQDDGAERRVREVIRGSYPRYLLGAVPVLLASEVSASPDDYRRLCTAVINAYLHPTMVRYLYRAEEEIRNRGYKHPLLVVHASGGTARVAKTMAIETYNSGPVAGLHGARAKAARYGHPLVITMDIGGTSTDLGLIRGGVLASPTLPTADRLPLALESYELRPIGGGGGSIAHISNGELRIGPRSSGAVPGPVSYGLGGTEPTVTDADLVLGLLSPDGFFGGNRRLDTDAASDAIRRLVAEPLGLSIPETAVAIRSTLERTIAESISDYAGPFGVSPADAVLYSFGGGGGLHAANVAAEVGIRTVICHPEAPVFSAYGVATMGVLHKYEAGLTVDLQDLAAGTGWDAVTATAGRLAAEATRDMRGEGIEAAAVTTSLALTWTDQDGACRQRCDLGALNAPTAESQERIAAFAASLDGAEGALGVAVIAVAATDDPLVGQSAMSPAGEASAKREVLGLETAGAVDVVAWDSIPAGQTTDGPLLVDSSFTTIWVPPGWTCVRDADGAMVLQREN